MTSLDVALPGNALLIKNPAIHKSYKMGIVKLNQGSLGVNLCYIKHYKC